ncbi:MAG: hypothetical protein WED10_05150 [Brumimicrobium sp.]
MIRLVIVLTLFFIAHPSLSQSTWKLMSTYKSENIISWDVDPMGKVIVAESGDVLKKLDTSFLIQFSQSSKNFGEISKIDAGHSLKSLVFSENQQQVGFIDNTLTFQEGIKDLSEEDISYAIDVCYSGQTNRYWVFDADNSRLVLLDNSRPSNTEINNLASITKAPEPTSIFESHNQLIMLYEGIGVYVFDYYGTLIRFIDDPKANAIHISKDYLYFIEENKMIRLNLRNLNKISLDLPIENIIDFRVLEQYIFFRTSEGIKKYVLNQV